MSRDPYPMMAVGDLYTREQLELAQEIYNNHQGESSSQPVKDELRDRVVLPALDKINQVTGQQNDPDFMAYALIIVFNQLASR